MQTLKPRVAVASNRVALLPAPSRANDYRIRGRALQTIRQGHLRDQPLCVHCLDKGRVTAATEVDHRIALSKGGADAQDNRQSLCHQCHTLKTIEDTRV